MEIDKPLRVFVPFHIKWAPTGILIGCYNENERVCCVTGIVHSSQSGSHQIGKLADLLLQHSPKRQLHILGILENSSEVAREVSKIGNELPSFCLKIKSRDCCIVDFRILGTLKSLEKEAFMIYYEPSCVAKSIFLGESVHSVICACNEGSLDYASYSTSAVDSHLIKGNIDFLIFSLFEHNLVIPQICNESDFRVTPSIHDGFNLPSFISAGFHKITSGGLKTLSICNRYVVQVILEL